MAALCYGGAIHAYLSSRRDFDALVFYENLCKVPRQEIEALLKLLQISADENNLALALEALKNDSQAEREMIRHRQRKELSTEEMDLIDNVLKKLRINLSCKMSDQEFTAAFQT